MLVEALAADMTYQEAGHEAGISSRTVARRVEDPAFAAALKARRREVAEEAITYLRRIAGWRARAAHEAQQVLISLLQHEDPRIQLAAAQHLHGNRAVQAALNVEERLLQLEGRLDPAPPT